MEVLIQTFRHRSVSASESECFGIGVFRHGMEVLIQDYPTGMNIAPKTLGTFLSLPLYGVE